MQHKAMAIVTYVTMLYRMSTMDGHLCSCTKLINEVIEQLGYHGNKKKIQKEDIRGKKVMSF